MAQPSVKRIARYFGKRENALAFDRVRDPRKLRGRRWSLRSLLSATFLGMVALEHSFRGVERLTQSLKGCSWRFKIGRRVPDSTLARLYGRLNDEAGLRACLVEDVRRAQRRKALAPVGVPVSMAAIDGQTLWCSRKQLDDPCCQAMPQDSGPHYRLHALHAVLVSASSQPCIDQMMVPAETNEMGAFAAFIAQLVASYGESLFEVVSMDAGMTSRENAEAVSQARLRYVMAVKGTQPTLLAEIKRLCGWGEHKQAGYVCDASTAWEHYRGRKIRRDLYRSSEIACWPGWESAHQAWRVKQTTEFPSGRREVANRYFITSLPRQRASGDEILRLVRLHWGVENGCHWTLDVVMGQDRRPWCTTGLALRMLSWVRLLAYNALRQLRDRYLRSTASRSMSWDELRRLIEQTLRDATAWVRVANAEAATATLE